VTYLGVHHVQLAIPAGGEPKAEAFYGELLGFEQVAKPPDLAQRGGCWFRSASVELHLGVEEPFAPSRKAHPAFLVASLEEIRRRLRAGGVEAVDDTQLAGHHRFYAHDPFGNRLEFIASLSGKR
jgi:catechol 2,3-dioxygenase-like lactoylglutathione lyase family enzyme